MLFRPTSASQPHPRRKTKALILNHPSSKHHFQKNGLSLITTDPVSKAAALPTSPHNQQYIANHSRADTHRRGRGTCVSTGARCYRVGSELGGKTIAQVSVESGIGWTGGTDRESSHSVMMLIYLFVGSRPTH